MAAPTGQLAIPTLPPVGASPVHAGPAPTGQLAIPAAAVPSSPAATQVLSLPTLRGRSRRASGARVVAVALAVVGLVLGTVSLIGDPAALADSTDTAAAGADTEVVDPGDGSGESAGSADDVDDGAGAGAGADGEGPLDSPGDVLDEVAVGIEAPEPADLLEEISDELEVEDDDAAGVGETGGQATVRDGVVYLTFDDGPHPVYTPQVLDILARHNAKATFFVLGSLAEAHPELIDRIVAEGHTVANHSWAHRDLATLTQAEFNESIGRTEAVLGEHATACLRPPYGSVNENTRAWAAAFGLELVLWDTDTVDWQKPGVDAIADAIVDGARNGRPNILLHDGGGDRTQSVLALEQALDELSGDGLRFEPLCR